MSFSRYEVQLGTPDGGLQPLRLALDDKGLPMWKTNLLDPIRPTSQLGEASYASFAPKYSGFYTQGDLTDGVGKKVQVEKTDADANRYYYAEWMDWSIRGQGQKGPKVTTVTAPANFGTLTGYFEINNIPYLVGYRKIAAYSNGVLTEKHDLASANLGHGTAAVFSKMSGEGGVDSSTGDTATDTIVNVDGALAQQVVPNGAGIQFISRVDCKLITGASAIAGDVRLRICGDKAGKPNVEDVWATASMAATTVPTTAGGTVISFKFDADTTSVVAMSWGEPFWLVLDAASATAANTMGWRRGGTDTYSRGLSATTTNRGNTWTTSGAQDYYFTVYTKPIASVAFVGVATDNTPTGFFTSGPNDGSVWTQDSTNRESGLFTVVGDCLVRDKKGQGAIVFSTDGGATWSDIIPVGDPGTACTALIPLSDTLVIVKTDSIWVCDITTDQSLQIVDSFSSIISNGLGSCAWKGNVYMPISGCLAMLTGDWNNGFTLTRSVGPESLTEWDFPHGAGRVVATAGDRFNLYAILSASGGYRLYKSSDPSKAKWHGSIATIGDGSQTVQAAYVYDAGGTNNPHLFVTTTGNNIADIVLARVPNPASDPNYLYDNSNTGKTYLPRVTGLLWMNPKAWLTESVTFQQARSGDYVDVLYDLLDSAGWRRTLDQGGRLFDTGVVRFPVGTSSLILAPQINMVNTLTTQCPLLLAIGTTFAVRPIRAMPLRNIEFTVLAEDGLTASTLGDVLGIEGATIADLLDNAALAGGTRPIVSPFGKRYDGCLFLDCEDTILDLKGADSSGLRAIKVTAAQVQ